MRRKGGDDVVRLVAGKLGVRYPQTIEHLLDQLHLPPELLRRRTPGGLVVRVGLIAERFPPCVEGHSHMAWLLRSQQPDQHRDEAMHRIRVLPRRGLEILSWQGEEGPVGHGVSVDEQQAIHAPNLLCETDGHDLRHRGAPFPAA